MSTTTGDLIDLLPDHNPDFGARGTVRFIPTDNEEEEK